MKTVLDERGTLWYYSDSPPDPLWTHVLKPLHSGGFPLSEIILPEEVPVHLRVLDPDWDSVVSLWETSGDSPEFRQSLRIQEVRMVLLADHQEESE